MTGMMHIVTMCANNNSDNTDDDGDTNNENRIQ